MDGLPLALEMLAVRLGQPRQSPQRIFLELKKASTAIDLKGFKETAGATIATAGVYAAITGTLAALPEEIREQLSALGYLADAPMPYALVAALAGVDEDGLDTLLGECSRRSVLRREEKHVVVHALTTAAIAAINGRAALQTALERAGPRLASINEDDPVALRAELAHHERLHFLGAETLGGGNRKVLGYANSLAIAYGTAGRTDEAARLYEETLAAQERVLGPEHPDTLGSRNNLALAYSTLGRTEEALRLDEDTWAVRERTLGSHHRDTLASRNNLARGYLTIGRTEEAVRVHEETLAVMERVLGVEHPETLVSRSGLASGYHAAGRTEEAVRLWEETLAGQERVLGPEHPDTLGSRHNLAIGFDAVGREREAIGLWEDTLVATERVLGPEHLDAGATRYALARAYRAAGRGEDADRLESKAAKGKPKRKRPRKEPDRPG